MLNLLFTTISCPTYCHRNSFPHDNLSMTISHSTISHSTMSHSTVSQSTSFLPTRSHSNSFSLDTFPHPHIFHATLSHGDFFSLRHITNTTMSNSRQLLFRVNTKAKVFGIPFSPQFNLAHCPQAKDLA